jgi:hypothetical protein
MQQGEVPFETARAALLHSAVGALEGCLPEGAPVRAGGARDVWDVLVDDLVVADVRTALRGVAAGAGGELKPTSVPLSSARTSCSIFIASRVTRGTPGETGSPAARLMATTVPAKGAITSTGAIAG